MGGRDRNHSALDNISRFGFWIVRTMNGREQELVEEMKRCRLEVLGVSEAKVRGNGVRMFGDTTCVYSGVQGGRAKAGVSVLVVRTIW